MQVTPKMKSISLEVLNRNATSEGFTLYASRSVKYPTNIAGTTYTWAAVTPTSANKATKLVIERVGDEIDEEWTITVAMYGKAFGGAMEFAFRWISVVPLEYGVTQIEKIPPGGYYAWSISTCDNAPVLALDMQVHTATSPQAADTIIQGCYAPETPPESPPEFFEHVYSGDQDMNSQALMHCNADKGYKYAWLIYPHLGYCSNFLPSIKSTRCQNLEEPNKAYGGQWAVAVAQKAPVAGSASVQVYVQSIPEMMDIDTPSAAVPVGRKSELWSSSSEAPALTYVIVWYNQTAATFPPYSALDLNVSAAYTSNRLSLCGLHPSAASVTSGTGVTLTGRGFNGTTVCRFSKANGVGKKLEGDANIIAWVYPHYISPTNTSMICKIPTLEVSYLNSQSTGYITVDAVHCSRPDRDGILQCDAIFLSGYLSYQPVNTTALSILLWDPASVKVTSLAPWAQLVNRRGRTVVVTGSGFFNTGIVKCKFGAGTAGISSVAEIISDGTYSSATSVVCPVPLVTVGGYATLEISLNGDSYTSDGITFQFLEIPKLSAISPHLGPIEGGILITISGTGFSSLDLPMKLKFAEGQIVTMSSASSDAAVGTLPVATNPITESALLINVDGLEWLTLDTTFTFYPEPTVTTSTPSSASIQGGTQVIISGTNFVTSGYEKCRFNSSIVTAVVTSKTTMVCTVPTATKIGFVDVSISIDGQYFVKKAVQWTWEQNERALNGTYLVNHPAPWYQLQTGAMLYYDHNQVSVISIWPNSGPVLGGTTITVSGSGFEFPTSGLACIFGTIGATATLFARVTGVSSTVTCTVPASAGLLGNTLFSLSLDYSASTSESSQHRTALASGFVYTPVPNYTKIVPFVAPVTGGTRVSVHGSGFVVTNVSLAILSAKGYPQIKTTLNVTKDSNGTLSLHFFAPAITLHDGEKSALSNLTVAFDGVNFFDTGLQFIYYVTPTITSFTPLSGPATSFTEVTIHGVNFPVDAKSDDIMCRLEQTVWSAPLCVGNNSCPEPKVLSSISDLNSNGTTVTGTGVYRWVMAKYVSSSKVLCPVPRAMDHQAKRPQPIVISMSFNGGKDIQKIPTPYYYYASPTIVLGIAPTGGPAGGGTKVYIWGVNFTETGQIKCKFGSAVVDAVYLKPGTVNETIYKYTIPNTLNSINLTSAVKCTSPSMVIPSESVLTGLEVPLEVSFNGQTYTREGLKYLYYPSPAVSELLPSCGPVRGGTIITLIGSNIQANVKTKPGMDSTITSFGLERSCDTSWIPTGSSCEYYNYGGVQKYENKYVVAANESLHSTSSVPGTVVVGRPACTMSDPPTCKSIHMNRGAWTWGFVNNLRLQTRGVSETNCKGKWVNVSQESIRLVNRSIFELTNNITHEMYNALTDQVVTNTLIFPQIAVSGFTSGVRTAFTSAIANLTKAMNEDVAIAIVSQGGSSASSSVYFGVASTLPRLSTVKSLLSGLSETAVATTFKQDFATLSQQVSIVMDSPSDLPGNMTRSSFTSNTGALTGSPRSEWSCCLEVNRPINESVWKMVNETYTQNVLTHFDYCDTTSYSGRYVSELSLNGQQYTTEGKRFQYYEEPQIYDIFPSTGINKHIAHLDINHKFNPNPSHSPNSSEPNLS